MHSNYNQIIKDLSEGKIPTVEEALKQKQEEAQKAQSIELAWSIKLQAEVAQAILFKVEDAITETLKRLEAFSMHPDSTIRQLVIQYSTLRATRKAILTNTEIVEKYKEPSYS